MGKEWENFTLTKINIKSFPNKCSYVNSRSTVLKTLLFVRNTIMFLMPFIMKGHRIVIHLPKHPCPRKIVSVLSNNLFKDSETKKESEQLDAKF